MALKKACSSTTAHLLAVAFVLVSHHIQHSIKQSLFIDLRHAAFGMQLDKHLKHLGVASVDGH
jgi:hypothetical protein